jgi:DNA-binding transcriptional MerR regulator
VKVFRTDDFSQVATIPVGALPHGLWPSGDGTRIYVGLENGDGVTAIDTLTNTAARYRIYGRSDVNRLAFVKRSRDLGFTIEEVRALLVLAQDVDRNCKEVDAIARRHLTDVEGKIGDLRRLAKELRHVIGQCQGGSISECRITEALAPHISEAV